MPSKGKEYTRKDQFPSFEEAVEQCDKLGGFGVILYVHKAKRYECFKSTSSAIRSIDKRSTKRGQGVYLSECIRDPPKMKYPKHFRVFFDLELDAGDDLELEEVTLDNPGLFQDNFLKMLKEILGEAFSALNLDLDRLEIHWADMTRPGKISMHAVTNVWLNTFAGLRLIYQKLKRIPESSLWNPDMFDTRNLSDKAAFVNMRAPGCWKDVDDMDVLEVDTCKPSSCPWIQPSDGYDGNGILVELEVDQVKGQLSQTSYPTPAWGTIFENLSDLIKSQFVLEVPPPSSSHWCATLARKEPGPCPVCIDNVTEEAAIHDKIPAFLILDGTYMTYVCLRASDKKKYKRPGHETIHHPKAFAPLTFPEEQCKTLKSLFPVGVCLGRNNAVEYVVLKQLHKGTIYVIQRPFLIHLTNAKLFFSCSLVQTPGEIVLKSSAGETLHKVYTGKLLRVSTGPTPASSLRTQKRRKKNDPEKTFTVWQLPSQSLVPDELCVSTGHDQGNVSISSNVRKYHERDTFHPFKDVSMTKDVKAWVSYGDMVMQRDDPSTGRMLSAFFNLPWYLHAELPEKLLMCMLNENPWANFAIDMVKYARDFAFQDLDTFLPKPLDPRHIDTYSLAMIVSQASFATQDQKHQLNTSCCSDFTHVKNLSNFTSLVITKNNKGNHAATCPNATVNSSPEPSQTDLGLSQMDATQDQASQYDSMRNTCSFFNWHCKDTEATIRAWFNLNKGSLATNEPFTLEIRFTDDPNEYPGTLVPPPEQFWYSTLSSFNTAAFGENPVYQFVFPKDPVKVNMDTWLLLATFFIHHDSFISVLKNGKPGIRNEYFDNIAGVWNEVSSLPDLVNGTDGMMSLESQQFAFSSGHKVFFQKKTQSITTKLQKCLEKHGIAMRLPLYVLFSESQSK